MKTFTDYAVEKMEDLYSNHDKEVGSQLKKAEPNVYKDYKATDCITYALNVISHAFKQVGKADVASKVWTYGNQGSKLSAYLVNQHAWKGIYINPDTIHPLDANAEHAFSSALVNRNCTYYDIPIHYKVVNYRPTAKTQPAYKKINPGRGETKLNEVDMESLRQIRFGFGISKGGMHTWLFSRGDVYEVHWGNIGITLYEKSPLTKFPWLSGSIVVPSDQAAAMLASSKVRCN